MNSPSSKKLKVMFLITSMPVGGAETLLVNLVRRMDSERFSPMICCLKEKGPLGEEIADEFPVFENMISHKWDVRVVGRLAKLFRDQEVDAIVTVGAGDKMFWGRLAARQARVPVVLSALHSTGWPDGVGRLNRWLTGITDGFIAVAEPHGEFLVDFEKFPRDKVTVIPNGVDTDRFRFDPEKRDAWRKTYGIGGEAPVLGIVAALRPEKNHSLFLHAAGKLLRKNPECHFLIVGDGPQRDMLESIVGENKLESKVHFTGSQSDIEGLLSAMDVFVLTSHNEASPVSILEAMACGRPVVATNVGSVSGSVLDGNTGYLVEPGDADAIASRLESLTVDIDSRKKFGERARRHVENYGSLQVMVRGYENLIEEIYNRKSGIRSRGIPTESESARASECEPALGR